MLTDTRQVIKALGGLKAVMELTGRNYNAAWHWTRKPTFPANTFVVMQQALAQQGKKAPASLWSQHDA